MSAEEKQDQDPIKFCDGLDTFIRRIGHVVMWTNGILIFASKGNSSVVEYISSLTTYCCPTFFPSILFNLNISVAINFVISEDLSSTEVIPQQPHFNFRILS